MNMNLSNKRIFAAVLVAIGLVLLFGVAAPALISAKATELVALGFGLLILTAIGGIILVRNALGLNPSDDK
jgi:hypothetical protein